MDRTQILIIGGTITALAVALITVFYVQWGAPDPLPQNAGERVAYAARWLLVPGMALFLGVAATSGLRFLLPDARDGQRQVNNSAFEITQRYNLNTLEQSILAAVAWLGLALTLPLEDIGVVARLAVLFGVGRLAFWIGYVYRPWARSFGMALTAYPTYCSLIWLVWISFAPPAV